MELIEAIKSRKSIRDFKSDPVPREILEKILEIAVRAPSGTNKQPWEFALLSGPVLQKIGDKNIELMQSGRQPQKGVGEGIQKDSIYRKRQMELAIELYRLMDIARDDKEKRAEWMARGFRYFNAPTVIILMIDDSLSIGKVLLEMGAVMQTICLTALEFDLGTCIEGQGVAYPDVIQEYAEIPKNKRIIMSIAIGYPNWSFPANKINTPRISPKTVSFWRGFD